MSTFHQFSRTFLLQERRYTSTKPPAASQGSSREEKPPQHYAYIFRCIHRTPSFGREKDWTETCYPCRWDRAACRAREGGAGAGANLGAEGAREARAGTTGASSERYFWNGVLPTNYRFVTFQSTARRRSAVSTISAAEDPKEGVDTVSNHSKPCYSLGFRVSVWYYPRCQRDPFPGVDVMSTPNQLGCA